MAGVLQGDTLAPFLFITVLDFTLRRAIDGREAEIGFTITPRQSRPHPAVTETDLGFADDIALLSDTVEQAQKLLLQVESDCWKVGLCLNARKTEVVCINTTLKTTPDH